MQLHYEPWQWYHVPRSTVNQLTKEYRYLVDDLIGFGIATEQWIIEAKNEECEWHKRVKPGAELFMTWIAAERARVLQRHAERCPSVAESTKERVVQSKFARAGSLAAAY